MIRTFAYPSKEAEERINHIVRRGIGIDSKVEREVRGILAAVRRDRDRALIRYVRQFDAPSMDINMLRVSEDEIKAAYKEVDNKFLEIIKQAICHIEDFHKRQLRTSWFEARSDGTIVGQMIRPVTSAGIYVPGGKGGETPLISTVLMGAVPARLAGVKDIALVTPPRSDGSVNSFLLVAAHEAGVSRIYKLGSAWAIAALAYGTETIKPVDIIVGPGNIYVTLAKKLLLGEVGIDLLAGPSEILVIADADADPRYIASDLISQAEHDAMATSVLVTPSREIAELVASNIEDQIDRLPRRDIARASLESYGTAFVTRDLDQAIEVANHIAPEHLELMVADPWVLLGRISNAGAIFIGPNSPEAVGDYFAGPNHILPTAGTARFASALGVEHFLKKTSIIAYSEKALEQDAESIIRLAELESLEAHAASIKIRLKTMLSES